MGNRLAPPTEKEQESLRQGKLTSKELITHQRERAPSWLIGFRNITNTTNERTAIFSLLPRVAVGHSMPLVFMSIAPELQLCFIGNVDSLAFDYVVRQKLGGTNLTFGYVYQLPILPPSFYRTVDVAYVASRVLELVYTADDMQPLADALRAGASPLAEVAGLTPLYDDEYRQLSLTVHCNQAGILNAGSGFLVRKGMLAICIAALQGSASLCDAFRLRANYNDKLLDHEARLADLLRQPDHLPDDRQDIFGKEPGANGRNEYE
jgi:hypothetical protein